MISNQNRGRHKYVRRYGHDNPLPEDVKTERLEAAQTQEYAAGTILCTANNWSQWESGNRRMHQAFWLLWRIKRANILGLLRQCEPLADAALQERIRVALAYVEEGGPWPTE